MASTTLWRRRGRIAGGLLLLAGFLSANHGLIAGGASVKDHAIGLGADAEFLQRAEFAAKSQFDSFLNWVVISGHAGHSDAAIKVAVTKDEFGTDFLWVAPFTYGNGVFSGRLADAPGLLQRQLLPDQLRFTRDQVRDWSFVGPDGKLYGSFTTRALLPFLPQSQSARIASVLSDNPVPAQW